LAFLPLEEHSFFFLVFVFCAGERKKPGAFWATKEENTALPKAKDATA
jgi:hypothetical protein